jgi:fumarylacetoacetate (FAA) hydrolase
LKLGSLKHGRDGSLAVVSRDLTRAVVAQSIAPTMQAALDQWAALAPRLAELYDGLNSGRAGGAFDFRADAMAAPLPRAYQWADGSAYVNHVELLRKSRGAELPASFWSDPLMYQGGSDLMLGPTDDIVAASEEWGIDFEGEVAIVTGEVPMGIAPAQAAAHIRLVMLVNDVSLRNLIPPELAKGFGFFHGKPHTAFSPIAVTPDELGEAWDGARVHLPLITHLNGQLFGRPDAGTDMVFDFPRLISHAAHTRFLGAGTIIGSGTVSNRDRSVGSSCIAERRTIETIDEGKPRTPYLRFGDRVRIEMLDRAGNSIFGAIDQRVRKYDAQRQEISTPA